MSNRELDQEGLSEVFGLGPSRSPGSGVFKGIKELRPAHALTFSKDGLKIWRYWNVKSEPHQDSLDETAEKIRFLFTDAVTRQLVSDVPLCTFLIRWVRFKCHYGNCCKCISKRRQRAASYVFD